MNTVEPVRVLIEIRQTADTIVGWVALNGEQATDFYGWLELIDRLDAAASLHGPEGRAEAEPDHEQGADPAGGDGR